MYITEYSVLMALIVCDLFFVAAALLRMSNKVILKVGSSTLIAVVIASLIRLFMSLDIRGFTRVIRHNNPLMNVFRWVRVSSITAFGLEVRLWHILIILWIVVSVGLILFLTVSQLYGLWYYHKGFVYSERQRRAWKMAKEIADELGIKRNIDVIVTTNTSIPLMSGLAKLTVFLPDVDYSDVDLRNELLHELTHFKNNDTWYKLFIKMSCALLWWNIPIWCSFFNIDKSLELKCDYTVIKNMSKEEELGYMQSLLVACRTKVEIKKGREMLKLPSLSMGMVNTGEEKDIKQRIRIITQYRDNPRFSRRVITLIMSFVTLIYVLSFAFVVQPYEDAIYEEDVSIESDSEVFAILRDDGLVEINFGIDSFDNDSIFIVTYEEYLSDFADIPIRDK